MCFLLSVFFIFLSEWVDSSLAQDAENPKEQKAFRQCASQSFPVLFLKLVACDHHINTNLKLNQQRTNHQEWEV